VSSLQEAVRGQYERQQMCTMPQPLTLALGREEGRHGSHMLDSVVTYSADVSRSTLVEVSHERY